MRLLQEQPIFCSVGISRSRDFGYQAPPLFSRALKRSGRLGTRLASSPVHMRKGGSDECNQSYSCLALVACMLNDEAIALIDRMKRAYFWL